MLVLIKTSSIFHSFQKVKHGYLRGFTGDAWRDQLHVMKKEKTFVWFRDQNFVLNYLHQPYRQPYVGAGIAHGHLAACLEHGASPESILTAILQV